MRLLRLSEYVNYYDRTPHVLDTVCKKLSIPHGEGFIMSNIKREIRTKLSNYESLNKMMETSIPLEESYSNFKLDLFYYFMGIPLDDQPRLEKVLTDWGVQNCGIIPTEIYEYILTINRPLVSIRIEDYIPQSNEHSLILKFLIYIYELSTLSPEKGDKTKVPFHKMDVRNNITGEMLYLLTKKYNILNVYTKRFLSSTSIFQWLKEYGISNIIYDLYDLVLGKKDIRYKTILDFMNIFDNNNGDWINSDYLINRFDNAVLDTLYYHKVLNKAFYQGKKVYQISNIGYVLLNKSLPKDWENTSNIISIQSTVYVPNTDCPDTILDLFDKYKPLSLSDYLLVFKYI